MPAARSFVRAEIPTRETANQGGIYQGIEDLLINKEENP